jgi:DNA-binding PadR family transcriptional regulator
LESLERKGLIASAVRVSADAVGRLRPIRYYEVTDLGMQLATAEYQAQVAIIDEARAAFGRLEGSGL